VTDRGRVQLDEARAVWADFSRILTGLLNSELEVTA
jgi:hypothetical protein